MKHLAEVFRYLEFLLEKGLIEEEVIPSPTLT